MKRKIFIFVIVATIIRHSFGNQSQNTIEPGGENVPKTCGIQAAQDTTILKFTKGINNTFTAMRIQKSGITDNNDKVSCHRTNLTSLLKKETYTALAQGIDMYFNTVLRLSQNQNSWIDTTTRRSIGELIETIVVDIYEVIDISIGKDCIKIQHTIGEMQKVSISQTTTLCKGIIKGIRQGRKFSDEIENIINGFEEKAIIFTVRAINNVYAGISTLCNISSGNNTVSEDRIFAIENAQREASAALASGAKYVYALIRFLYCSLPMDQMDMSTILATLDSQQEKANRKIKQGIDIFVSFIKSSASNAMEANRNKMKNQSRINEIAENEVYEAWLEAINCLLDSNSLVQAAEPSTDTNSRHIAANALKDVLRITFEGIKAAQNESYAKCMLQLDRFQNETIASHLMLTKGLYTAAQNSRKDSNGNSRIVDDALNRTLPYAINASIGIFDGIKFLAKVLSESKDILHDGWSALDIAASEAYSGWTKEIDIYYELYHFFVVSSSVENDEIVNYFFAIRSTRDIAISEFCKGIRLIFIKMETDLKDKYFDNDDSSCEESTENSSQQLHNLSAGKDFKIKTTVTLRGAINAIMDLFATTHLANSSAIESAVTASVAAMMDTIDDIFRSMDSTEGEECTENVSEMHNTESSSITRAVAIFKSIFAVIQSGQKNETDKNKAAIKQAQSETISNTVSAWYAIYDGIALFKREMNREIQGRTEDSYSAMKAAEMKACSAMETNVKIIISLIQTLVISSNTKPDEISTMLAAIQSARKITAVYSQRGLGVIFESMRHVVNNSSSSNQTNYKIQPNPDSSMTKFSCIRSTKCSSAINLTFDTFKTAIDGFFDLNLKIQPEAIALIKMSRKAMYIAIDQLVENIFVIIELIQCKISSGILVEIDVMRKTAACSVRAIVANYYIPILSDLKPGTEIYNEVIKAEENTAITALNIWNEVFTGLEILFYEIFPALDDGSRANLPSMDDVENKSRSPVVAAVRFIYDAVLDKFLQFLGNHNKMPDCSCFGT